MSLGPLELVVILAVLLLVVGPAVLPRITRNLGKSVGSFQRGLREGERRDELSGTLEREEPPVEDDGAEDPAPPRLPRPGGGNDEPPAPGA